MPSTTPAPARADLTSAALITIDVQRDVLDSGPLGVPGTAAVVPRIRRLADAFRRTRLPVVHVVRFYLADGSNAEPCRRALLAEAAATATPILRPGTDGAELAEGVAPPAAPRLDADLLLAGGTQQLGAADVADVAEVAEMAEIAEVAEVAEVALYKPRWGAFYNTALDAHLRGLAVDTLVFCGANFPNCPRTSVYEASERDYRVILATDATSGVYPRGIAELDAIGVATHPTETIIRSLPPAGAASYQNSISIAAGKPRR